MTTHEEDPTIDEGNHYSSGERKKRILSFTEEVQRDDLQGPSFNSGLVKRGMKKKQKRKKSTKDSEGIISAIELAETDYFFRNGFRFVNFYYYLFETFAKERWIGKPVLDVLESEFTAHSRAYYEKKIYLGDILINNQKITTSTVFHHLDVLSHRAHRHEPPVLMKELKFIAMDENMVVIDKPPSIPVHPCGRYRHNSVLFIMAKEYNMNQLYPLHRLDRLTSGILAFARNKCTAKKYHQQMREGKIKKIYIAKVHGKFPEEELNISEPILVQPPQFGLNHCMEPNISPEETAEDRLLFNSSMENRRLKDCQTIFKRLSYDSVSDTSIVECFPKTGRTHQIRVHLKWIGHPIANDPIYTIGETSFNGSTLDDNHDNSSVLPEETPSSSDHPIESSRNEFGTFSFSPPIVHAPDTTEIKEVFDPDCPDCVHPYNDPAENLMCLWLHALSYESLDFHFQTELPSWAQP